MESCLFRGATVGRKPENVSFTVFKGRTTMQLSAEHLNFPLCLLLSDIVVLCFNGCSEGTTPPPWLLAVSNTSSLYHMLEVAATVALSHCVYTGGIPREA